MRAPQIEATGPSHVLDAIEGLGRTEDVTFAPDGRRLAIAGFGQDKCLLVDLGFDGSADEKRVSLPDCVEITSACLAEPHGLAFVDSDTLVVANRSGKVCLLKLPPRGADGRAFAVAPLRTLRGSRRRRPRSPGSVAVSAIGRGRFEVLVCNNYARRVTRHVLTGRRRFWNTRNQVLLRRGLNVPDGVAVSRDRRWLAVSNHGTHEVLLFDRAQRLNARSEACGVLRQVAFPHGLRFTPDGRFVCVADAGAPVVNLYARKGPDWRGVHDPVARLRVMSDERFLAGRHNPEEGGPKGIDIDCGAKLLATTSETQPLAFFDLPGILRALARGPGPARGV